MNRSNRLLHLALICLVIPSIGVEASLSAQTVLQPGRTPAQTRRLLQRAMNGGGEILLKEGVYELDKPLETTGDVALTAAENANVVLSAGRRLSLQWRSFRDGILQARIPANFDLEIVSFDQLFVDGRRLHLARYPNDDPSKRYFGGTAADALSPDRIETWRRPAGGFIHSLHRHEWGGNHWRITGKKDDGTLELEGGWMNNRPSGINPKHRFVENIFEELDAPGEWFLDRKNRTLYVFPYAGMDLAKSEIVASGIERVIEVVGPSPTTPAKKFRLSGVTIAYTARTFMKTNEPLLRSDWMIHRGGAVYAENARDIQIEGCDFVGLGGNGVFVSGFAQDVVVRGCHFTDLGASAVCFVGKPAAVRSPSLNYGQAVSYEQLDKKPGPQTQDYPRRCVVEDCLMHDLGAVEKQTAGVQVAMAEEIRISHNSIYDVPRAGINIGDGCWGGHVIEGNDVFDTVAMTGDHGSFNSWGRDRFWRPNRSQLNEITSKHPELIKLDCVKTTIIRNNRFRCDHGWDIDLDDGSSNYHLYNNLCLNGGIKLREGFYRTVENNIMVNNSFHPHVWFQKSGDVFRRNIVDTWYKPIRVPDWGDEVDYNLLPNPVALKQSHELGLDEHSVAGDPLFVDEKAGDYRVKPGSPALKIGFKNFPMDRFGVLSPRLRAMARTPRLPQRGAPEVSTRPHDRRIWLGAKIKNVVGRGEVSASGLPSESGVLIVEAKPDSAAAKQGLKTGDVILKANWKTVPTVADLVIAYESSAEHVPLNIMRDQVNVLIEIKTGLGE